MDYTQNLVYNQTIERTQGGVPNKKCTYQQPIHKKKPQRGCPTCGQRMNKLPGSLDALSVGEFHHNLDGCTHGFPEFFPIFHTEFARIDAVG